MSKQKKARVPSAGGGCSDPAQEVRPDRLPAGAAAGEPESGAVPIGVPVPVDDYKALETQAKSARKPDAPGIAQADPGQSGAP